MSAIKLNTIVSNPILRAKLEKRFWLKVDRRGPDECWPWKGSTSKGYGQFMAENIPLKSHRVALALANGGITEGLHALHSCDNRECCNPQHLREGTNYDNVCDMLRRGRHGGKKASITTRSRYASGEIKISDQKRAALSASMKARASDPEFRRRLRENGLKTPPSFAGRKHTEATKEKLRRSEQVKRERRLEQKRQSKAP